MQGERNERCQALCRDALLTTYRRDAEARRNAEEFRRRSRFVAPRARTNLSVGLPLGMLRETSRALVPKKSWLVVRGGGPPVGALCVPRRLRVSAVSSSGPAQRSPQLTARSACPTVSNI